MQLHLYAVTIKVSVAVLRWCRGRRGRLRCLQLSAFGGDVNFLFSYSIQMY